MTDAPPSFAAPRRWSKPRDSGPADPIQASNTIEPVLQRQRAASRNRDDAQEAEATPTGRSLRAGDVPPAILSRYVSEASRLGQGLAFYEGPGAKRAAFHDHGSRLLTNQTHPAVARDLAAIAAHRGWSNIHVRGEDEFRRQAWLEARAQGLEVQGYRPRQRDEQELAKRLAADKVKVEAREARRPSTDRPSSRTPDRALPPRARAAEGVILDIGQAPYRRRDGASLTPYVRLDRGEAAPLEVWGSGLPAALKRSGAAIGDRVVVRRDGVERLDRSRDAAATPVEARRDLDDARLFAGYDAERFRRATSAQAARDPDLKGAQSHLAVLDAVIDRLVRDPERRTRLHAEARDIVADELAQGRRFPPARIRDVEPVLAKDVAEAFRRGREPERARAR